MNDYTLFLQLALTHYQNGALTDAKAAAKHALLLLQNSASFCAASQNCHSSNDSSSMDYLNILTLLQSIALRQHDFTAYESYEPEVKNLMQSLLGADAQSYYAMHLLDACDGFCNYGDVASAQWYLERATNILTSQNGEADIFSFYHAYYNAKIHFKLEQYYHCLDECLTANTIYIEALNSESLPGDSTFSGNAGNPANGTSFLAKLYDNRILLEQMEFSVLLLAGCSYGKINALEDGLSILTQLAETPPDDYYLRVSLDLCLAELYAKNGETVSAREIYEAYKNTAFTQYPDLASALCSLSFVLDEHPEALRLACLNAAAEGQLPASFYYGKDALQVQLYNHALSLAADGEYQKALSLFTALSDRGLSMRLALSAEIGSYSAIPDLKTDADRYFANEIAGLFLYYNEKLVFNHLTLLEHHFSLCLHAYLACHSHLGEHALPARSIYEFLLNTKGISLEASYLSRHLQTLDDLNGYRQLQSAQIMECLPNDTMLLEYGITRNLSSSFYCVFCITSEQISCVMLGETYEIDEALADWRNAILVCCRTHLQQTDAKLRRLLARPLKPYLSDDNIQKLIIAPAGALTLFAFDMLPLSASSYLGDRYQITYVNTGKELVQNHGTAAANALPLVIGNPSTSSFAPLPFAEKEAQMAAAALDTQAYVGKDAVLSLFDFEPENCPSLLHIATHGLYQDFFEHQSLSPFETPDWNTAFDAMEQSGLILSGDKLLSCNHISTLSFSGTGLAVLSACQTGLGLVTAAEGSYGLRRAFKLAGCHAMIVTLWQVEDRSCFLFMEAFYHALLQTPEQPENAFRSAICFLRHYTEGGTQPFSHPYYWAGYIYQR